MKTATLTVNGQSETVFTDGSGKTLYYFMKDMHKSVTCTTSNGCASFWTALKSGTSTPSVSGATGTWGTDPDPSGGSVVTYNGWPLYTFNSDTAPGQDKGEGYQDFGSIWYTSTPSLAATPSGRASGAPTPQPTSTANGGY